MTIQIQIPPGTRAIPGAGIPARVVALSGRQAAIFFDTGASALADGARLTALCDGRPFRGPVAVTRLRCERGGERHVLLVAHPAEELCTESVRVQVDEDVLARIDPMALQSPLVDPLAMVTGLDEAGCMRLLKLLLTTGASLFGKGDLGGFGVLVGHLLESLTKPVPLSAWCPVGRNAGILSWRLPADATLPILRDLCILHDGRARRFTDFTTIEETVNDERLLHLLISRPLPAGSDLIVLGERPVRLGGPDAAVARSLRGWLDRRGAQARARTLAWLDDLASGDAQVASIRDELACPAGSEPRLSVLHLSETPAGLLHLVSVDDPRGLLAAVRFSTASGSTDVSCNRLEWHPQHGAVTAGLAPMPGRSGGRVAVVPVYVSGRTGTATDAAPEAFEGRVPEAFQGLAQSVAASVLAQALPAAMSTRPTWRRRVTEFGLPRPAAGFAVVVAAGDAPEHLHAAVAALVAEPGGRSVEIIVHHADGPATELVRQTVAMLAEVHRLPIRLVAIAPDALPAERLRAALAESRAAKVLALGPGALPAGSGWLAACRRRIGRSPAAMWLPAAGCDGTPRDEFGAVGLNAAAVAHILSTRPSLPDVDTDLRSLPGLAHTTARGLSVTLYEDRAGCELTRAAERLAVHAAREAAHG